MAARSLNVLVLMGGVSGEHEISLRSAATVVPALREAGHQVTTVAISARGAWLAGDHERLLERARFELLRVDEAEGFAVALARGDDGPCLIALADGARVNEGIDVVFPVLHGPGGEDGTVQGLLEVVGVPFVGAPCTASALAMDKLAMKILCAGAAVPQADFLSAGSDDADEVSERVTTSFGFPCFVKPANLGSSVGISRVTTPASMADALAEARRWDERVIVEGAVDAREIEVALLGNEEPEISPPGEIVTPGGFYDFQHKYVGGEAELIVPAKLDDAQEEEICAISARVWDAIGCRGMARADFFVERKSGAVLFNELNTIPGFTEISMYPRLWREAGIDTPQLVDRLLALALGQATAVARTHPIGDTNLP